MDAAAIAWAVVAACAAAVAIVAFTTRERGLPPPLPYDDYLAGWRMAHGVEPDWAAGGWLDRYLRLPYAVATPLARAGVRPHVITVASLVAAGASVPTYLAGGRWPLLGGVFVLLSGLLDQADGAVAVTSRRTTAFGAIWDSTVDRVADVALLAGPAVLVAGNAPALAGVTAAGATAFLLEYVRARCQAVGYVNDQIATVAERPTRVVLIAVFAWSSALFGPTVWSYGGWALAALTAWSVGVLLRDAARRATGAGRPGS